MNLHNNILSEKQKIAETYIINVYGHEYVDMPFSLSQNVRNLVSRAYILSSKIKIYCYKLFSIPLM